MLCKTLTNSLKMGQNPVTKLDKVVYNLKKNYMNWISKFIKPKIKSLFEKNLQKQRKIFGLHVDAKTLSIKKTWKQTLKFAQNVVHIIN